MAEERIIDDEYGRGVRLRKTKDGFVDVTDELLDDGAEQEEVSEEISFAFPITDMDEDDEDLVGLTPEEAAALRKQKAEAAERLRAEYEATVATGDRLLAEENFEEAESVFEKALQLDAVATEASVGYWRAKTANFTNPDVLIEEYVEPGIESLEYDLGYEASEIIKKEYRSIFRRRYEELKKEEEPLFLEVSGKQERRREILKARRKKSVLAFVLSALPMLACIALTIVYGLKITSTPDGRHAPYAIGFGCAAAVLFFVFAVCSNKLLNTCRIYKANETLTATEEGAELFHIMECKDLYGALLEIDYDEESDEQEQGEE